MYIEGQCHCGALAFTAEVEPDKVTVCRCTDCQAMSGSAFRANIASPASRFHLTSGDPAICIKTAESGARRRVAFSAQCGSQIYACAEHGEGSYSLRTGTVKQREALLPAKQIWTLSAVPWARSALEVVMRFETQTPNG